MLAKVTLFQMAVTVCAAVHCSIKHLETQAHSLPCIMDPHSDICKQKAHLQKILRNPRRMEAKHNLTCGTPTAHQAKAQHSMNQHDPIRIHPSRWLWPLLDPHHEKPAARAHTDVGCW